MASYMDQLTEEEKQWLNNFSEEYVNANFTHSGDRIHPVVYEEYERKNGTRYVADKYKKDCEYNNNHRNMCIYTLSQSSGGLKFIDDLKDKEFCSIVPSKATAIKDENKKEK